VAEPDAAFAELKHADHRRLLSRWGKALFRYAGIKRDDFTRRQGSYRENFTNVLQVCFGSCFDGPGSYWYDNSNAGTFAAAIIYCATKGRVSLAEAQAYALFTKKQPDRAASSWMVNEAQLVQWGVSPAELKALFAGEKLAKGSVLSLAIGKGGKLTVSFAGKAKACIASAPLCTALLGLARPGGVPIAIPIASRCMGALLSVDG
jgi:hypothetical protein